MSFVTAEQRKENIEEFVDLAVNNSDMFMTGYIGYWARGLAHDDEKGWLLCEQEELSSNQSHKPALSAFKHGTSLPRFYHLLNREAIEKAYEIGEKKWGEEWWENADAPRYDFVIQMAILKEHKYG